MKTNKLTFKSILLLFLFTSYLSQAQEESDSTIFDMSLEELLNLDVTTASQTSEKLDEAPANIIVITKEQIRTRGYTNLQEIMEDIPEVEIQKNSASEFSNIYTIRGVSGNEKFIIMQDGIRISSHTGTPHAINENFSILHAERVEVVLGPASALYGVDAFSGVVNIITQKIDGDNFASYSSSYGSFNSTENSLLIGQKFSDDVSLLINSSYSTSSNPNFTELNKQDYAWYHDQYLTNGNLLFPNGDTTTVDNIETYDVSSRAYSISAKLKVKDFEVGYYRNMESHSSSLGMCFDPYKTRVIF